MGAEQHRPGDHRGVNGSLRSLFTTPGRFPAHCVHPTGVSFLWGGRRVHAGARSRRPGVGTDGAPRWSGRVFLYSCGTRMNWPTGHAASVLIRLFSFVWYSTRVSLHTSYESGATRHDTTREEEAAVLPRTTTEFRSGQFSQNSVAMNLFRFVGDMSHLLSIIVLLLKIRATRSCRGALLDLT